MRLTTEAMFSRLNGRTDEDTLGGRLWRARDAINLSARDLAQRLGVRPETVASWERDRAEPRTSRLFMLAGVLGVTPAWLIAGIGPAPTNDPAEDPNAQLREQLGAIKKLHAQTGKAILALEMELDRVLKDMR